MLCRKFGVDVKNFAIDRIPEELAGKSPKEIRAELSKTRSAMSVNMKKIIIFTLVL